MNWGLIARRVAAYSLDVLILALVLVPLAFLLRLLLELTFGFRPESGLEIWGVAVLSFSIPAWTYFCLSDASTRGATPGKRVLGLHVVPRRSDPGRLSIPRALARTAVKLLPWELAHLFGFALIDVVSDQASLVGLISANVLVVVYLVVLVSSGGRMSVHDHAVQTEVGRASADSGVRASAGQVPR